MKKSVPKLMDEIVFELDSITQTVHEVKCNTPLQYDEHPYLYRVSESDLDNITKQVMLLKLQIGIVASELINNKGRVK